MNLTIVIKKENVQTILTKVCTILVCKILYTVYKYINPTLILSNENLFTHVLYDTDF